MITYSEYEQTAIKVALTAIQQTLVTDNVLSSVMQVENYLKLLLADEPDEWFGSASTIQLFLRRCSA